jgi:PPOX class probable FMN-dependent enzyme
MTQPTDINTLSSIESLQAINGEPSASTQLKILKKLEAYAINFIERSPFIVIASGSTGALDASPRGDAPGFVKVLDDTTILIPERPGNRIADTLTNIVEQPAVGLILMIPGMNETLRINGLAYITDHAPYLDQLHHKNKAPKLAIVVDIQQVYFHCAKAFIRSNLWDQDHQMPRDQMPTLGKILVEQIKGQPASAEETAGVDANLDADTKENLY